MRPAPIPDEEVPDGARKIVVGPPDGFSEEDVAPVEALVEEYTLGETTSRALSVRCIAEGDDLVELANGGAVWITFYGVMVPFSVRVG